MLIKRKNMCHHGYHRGYHIILQLSDQVHFHFRRNSDCPICIVRTKSFKRGEIF